MKNVMMILMAFFLTTTILFGEAAGQVPPIPAEEQPEILMRGPVNESFAQPVNLEIQAGFTAPMEPPADIEEIPPMERPVGEQFAWVPGYWAWDSDRNGYVWVSGCWRAIPPNMSWVPGYWAMAAGGWQWVAGFWAPVGNNTIEYLPAPPALTGVEPPGPPPSQDRMWVPPCWYWNHGQYIRRPGYWIAAQEDWVWVPSHYIWTPRGYVLANGHWDYTLEHRGVLFAPAYFPRHSYQRPGFTFALSIVLDFGNLEAGLFTRPRYNHYYFGDYYDSSYISIGIFPWFEFDQRHTWYDPIYVQARWRHHKREPQWVQHNRQEYDRRRSDRSLRPPRTYREMESRASKMSEPRRKNFEIAAPITRVAASRSTQLTYERIKPEVRKQLPKHADEVRKFGQERSRWEAQGAARQTGQAARAERDSSGKTQEKAVPAVHTERREKPASDRKGLMTSPEHQRPTAVAPAKSGQSQPDRVKVQTSPVADKKGGTIRRKKPPTRPDEEQSNQKELDQEQGNQRGSEEKQRNQRRK